MKVTQKIIGGGAKKTLDLDAFFEYLQTQMGEGTVQAVYGSVAWLFRCVNIRANALSALPYKVLKGEREVKWEIPLERLLWHTEADLTLFGAAYWLKKKLGKAPMRLNPSSMEVKTNAKGIEKFVQTIEGKKTDYQPEKIVYFRYYSPVDDLGPGVAPAQVALEAAGIIGNLNVWASMFFKSAAVPLTVLNATEGAIDEPEQERIRAVWDRLVGGVKKAWRTMILQPGLEAKVIGSAPRDVAMPALEKSVRRQVAVAMGVRESLLEDSSANYATAISDRKGFYKETIEPEAGMITEVLNDQFFSKLTDPLIFRFDLEALEIFQEEEKDRSDAVLNLVQAGMRLESALEILGYDVPEGVDVTPVTRPQEVPQPQMRAWREDMKKWERKALNRLEETGNAAATFHSKHIPWMMELGLLTKLAYCKTANQVKAAFKTTGEIEEVKRYWVHLWPSEIPKEESDA